MREHSRRPIRLTVATAAVALVALAGCSSSDTSGGTASSTTASTPGSSTAGSTPGTTESDTTGTTAGVEEIGNDEILAALDADSPELAALVDRDLMSWNAFGGFIIPVPEGTDTATAIELCDAVSVVVYQGPDDSIVIATGVTIDNLQGTPIVERASEAETCAAV